LVAYIFNSLLEKASSAGIDTTSKRVSREWFRNQAKAVNANPALMLRSQANRMTNIPMIGRMYLFNYDPKGKKTLPYYDRYPLVIPIGSGGKNTGQAANGGSFLGLNLHYLPLPLRAKLMDALYSVASSKTIDDKTKLNISYNILNQAARYRFFKPCIKRYLISHVQSRFFYIEPTEWDMALFLPLDRFAGASKTAVYKDSRNRI
jgi:hypothetical protein